MSMNRRCCDAFFFTTWKILGEKKETKENQRRNEQWECQLQQPLGWCNGALSLCCVETVVMACWVCLFPHSLPLHLPHRIPPVWLWCATAACPLLSCLVCARPHLGGACPSEVFCAAPTVTEQRTSHSRPRAEASLIKGNVRDIDLKGDS